MRHFTTALLLALPLLGACGSTPEVPNTLTDEQLADGWVSLFDGETLDHWRSFQKSEVLNGWKAVDGTIARTGAGGDLITREQYGSFVLELDWKISPKGNSGIFFHVTEDRGNTWETGPEMQILDNAGYGNDLDPRNSAGANYALHAPVEDNTRPAGRWNSVRLEVRDGHVVHWQNDVKLLEYTLWTPEWKALVEDSKFGSMPDYGVMKRGHIALQDHGNPVWFRNVRILPLD